MDSKVNKLNEIHGEVKKLLDQYLENAVEDIIANEDSIEYSLALNNYLQIRAQLLTTLNSSSVYYSDMQVQTINQVEKGPETFLILNDPSVGFEEPLWIPWNNVIAFTFTFLSEQLIVAIVNGPSGNIIRIYALSNQQLLSELEYTELSNPRGIVATGHGRFVVSHYGNISKSKVRGLLEFTLDGSGTKIWFTGTVNKSAEDEAPGAFDDDNSKPTNLAFDYTTLRLYVLDIGCCHIARFVYPKLKLIKHWKLGSGLLTDPVALCVGPSNVVEVSVVCVYEKMPGRIAIFNDRTSTILMHINMASSGLVLNLAWLPCGNLCLLQSASLLRCRVDIYQREVLRYAALSLPNSARAGGAAFTLGCLVPARDNQGGLTIVVSTGMNMSLLGRVCLSNVREKDNLLA